MTLSVPVSSEAGEQSLEIRYRKTSAKFRWPELITTGRRLAPQNPMVKLFFGELDTEILQHEFKLQTPIKGRPKVVLRTESIATPYYVLTVMRDNGIEW